MKRHRLPPPPHTDEENLCLIAAEKKLNFESFFGASVLCCCVVLWGFVLFKHVLNTSRERVRENLAEKTVATRNDSSVVGGLLSNECVIT